MALLDKLSDHWFQTYRRQAARKTNVTDMFANGFTFLFDLEGSDHADGRGPQPPGVFPRVIAAYGLSQPPQRSRGPDNSRMRRWMVPTQSTFGASFDKGHFIAFSIGGEISGGETNIFPQSRTLNRGWSEEGRLYRRMEKHAADTGHLVFHRPVCEWETDTPDWLEVGIINLDLSLWVEVFNNRSDKALWPAAARIGNLTV